MAKKPNSDPKSAEKATAEVNDAIENTGSLAADSKATAAAAAKVDAAAKAATAKAAKKIEDEKAAAATAAAAAAKKIEDEKAAAAAAAAAAAKKIEDEKAAAEAAAAAAAKKIEDEKKAAANRIIRAEKRAEAIKKTKKIAALIKKRLIAIGRGFISASKAVGRALCRFGRFLKHLPATKNWAHFIKGIIKENPTLVGLLGMCPTLAITTMAFNGIGMGLATTFVLICSNIVISLLKNIIPKAVRLPCFIVIVASFVTFVGFILKGYIPALYDALGLYLALITVNCIILGRAEVFASKNKVVPSILDGLGMGLGFTAALTFIGAIREVLGSGSIFGIAIPYMTPMTIFILPAGGFFILGCVIALVNKLANKKPPEKLGCHGCPNADACSNCETTAALGGGKGGKA